MRTFGGRSFAAFGLLTLPLLFGAAYLWAGAAQAADANEGRKIAAQWCGSLRPAD